MAEQPNPRRGGKAVTYYTHGWLQPPTEPPQDRVKRIVDYDTNTFRQYYNNGRIMSRGHHDNGVAHGRVRLYGTDGLLRATGHYDHGVRQGLWQEKSLDGEYRTGLYERGCRVGQWLSNRQTMFFVDGEQFNGLVSMSELDMDNAPRCERDRHYTPDRPMHRTQDIAWRALGRPSQ